MHALVLIVVTGYVASVIAAAYCVYGGNMKRWRSEGEPETWWDVPFIMGLSFALSLLWPLWFALYLRDRSRGARTR